MTTVVGFVSEKGGVGKTTSVFHIAAGLVRYHDCRVLVLDTDYQRGGLTCRVLPDMLENFRMGEVHDTTLYMAYRNLYSGNDSTPQLTVRKTRYGFDIIPSDPRLNNISVDKMPPTNNLRDNNKMLFKHLTLIRKCIDNLPSHYDYILIDSHPDLHDLEKAVIFASDYILSPVKLDSQSAVGVPSTVEAIRNVDEDVRVLASIAGEGQAYFETAFLGALPMMCRDYGGSLKYSEQTVYNRLHRTSGVFEHYVTEGDGIRQAAEYGSAVYDITGTNAEKQTAQFQDVITEMLDRIQEMRTGQQGEE